MSNKYRIGPAVVLVAPSISSPPSAWTELHRTQRGVTVKKPESLIARGRVNSSAAPLAGATYMAHGPGSVSFKMVNREIATMAASIPGAVQMTSSAKVALKLPPQPAAIAPLAVAVVPVLEYNDDKKFIGSPSVVWFEKAVVRLGESEFSEVDGDDLDGYQVEIRGVEGRSGVGYPEVLTDDINFQSFWNDIGTMGTAGAGVGICPPTEIPAGFTEMVGTRDPDSDNYGNYEFLDGSVMCYVPAFYAKYGTGANGLSVNGVDIKRKSYYDTTALANADGYFLPRAFINGGAEKNGVFIDKYLASKNAKGSGFVASSIKNGAPISTNSAHNPIADLTAISTNAYFECVTAAKARDGVDGAVNANSIFFCNTRFNFFVTAILSLAHGQAATSTTHCAWWDGAGITNFPKGNNNNALGDTNDPGVTFTHDGYVSGNSSLTGSGSPFAKTTHNGQNCGIADLNGNMWELNLGLTRPGASATDSADVDDATLFFALKESVRVEDLTSGWNTGNDAWGDASHLATLYDQITIAHITNEGGWVRFGNGANQVLSEALSGDDYKIANLGIYKDGGQSASGTNRFGQDGIFQNHQSNLAALSGGHWTDGSLAGLWSCGLNAWRSNSNAAIGFRCACYPV